MKPKWMLTHPSGNLMVAEAIKNLNLSGVSNVYLVILKEHVDRYKCISGLRQAFYDIGVNDLKIVVLDGHTKNQPETVAKAIVSENITGPIFIKDSDNAFKCEVVSKNSVAIFDLNKMGLVNAANKSYITLDDNQLISNIVEKEVISPLFCVGGYSFADSQEFLNFYNKLKDHESLYISHIIYAMILQNIAFEPINVSDYIDWGTLQDWDEYKSQYCTLFTDLDGVLIENSGQYFEPLWGQTGGIKDNIEIVNKLYDTGNVKIIITTARREEFRDITMEQLKREGIKYHQIIFGLFHSKRIVINDYSRTNPFKSCDAINVKRNSSDLKEMLEDSLGFKML